jgi:hypothetical protein
MTTKVSENVLRLARLNREDFYSKNASDDTPPAERASMLAKIRAAQKTMKTNEAYAPYLKLKVYAHLNEPEGVDEVVEEPVASVGKPTNAERMKTWRANNRDASRTYMREYMREYRGSKRELV